MKNEKQNDVAIPRWHYRDTQAAVRMILEDVRENGTLRGALINYLKPKQDKLRDGMTVEATVDEILKVSGDFAVATAEGRTADDIRNTLRETIREMDPRQAIVYLASLEMVFRSCDGIAVGGKIPDVAALQSELQEAAETVSEEEIGARIEKLAGMILGDSLTAYVYASGNAELASVIRQETIGKEGISADTASGIHEVLLDNSRKTELYAVTACVCYGMVLDGKIEGVTAENLDAGVVTALVSAGQEKASILMRLMRGEIDKELAMDMLSALAKALKWILVKLGQVSVFMTTSILNVVAISAVLGFLGFTLTSGWWLLAIGVLACAGGVCIACSSKEAFEEVIDLLGILTQTAVSCICGAVSWCWEKGKELISGTVVPQTSNAHETKQTV